MEPIAMILQYGILILLAMLVFSIFIMMLSFFISGKIMGSINDEFISSVKLAAFLILLGIALSLISVGFQVYLPSFSVVAHNVLLVLSLVATIALINRVYDLGYLKSFFFFIISTILYGIVAAGVFFAVAFLTPEPEPPEVFEPWSLSGEDTTDTPDSDSESTGEAEEDSTDDKPTEQADEAEAVEDEIVEEETEPEEERKGPALPGSTSSE